MSTEKQGSMIGTAAWSLAVLLAMFIMFALMIVPAMNHGTHPDMPHGYIPPSAPAGLTEFTPYLGKQAPGIDLDLALSGDPEHMDWARNEYATICAACHGTTGMGDGPVGKVIGARNFTDKEGWKNGPRKDQIFRTLSHGIAPMMPSYDTYSPAQRFALANVVADLRGFKAEAIPAADLAKLDEEYSLVAGVKEASRIPVQVAVALLCDEQTDHSLKMEELPPALKRFITDAGRAGQTMSGIPDGDDLAEAARCLCAGAPANGFSTLIASLSLDDWREFLQLLRDAAAKS